MAENRPKCIGLKAETQSRAHGRDARGNGGSAGQNPAEISSLWKKEAARGIPGR